MTARRLNKRIKMHPNGSHVERFLRGVGFLQSCYVEGCLMTDESWLPVACFQEFL
jgi:hypothetical protein